MKNCWACILIQGEALTFVGRDKIVQSHHWGESLGKARSEAADPGRLLSLQLRPGKGLGDAW